MAKTEPVTSPREPRGPWIMQQRWHDLLFAHWPVPTSALQPFLPAPLVVDTFHGTGWVSIVPFWMSEVRPRGLPALPRVSSFPELNVRTYVADTERPGVYFFSLDAASALFVWSARIWPGLPYYRAAMRCEHLPGDDGIAYASHRTHPSAPAADLRVTYRPTGPGALTPRGSIERWLTHRFALFTVNDRRQVRRLDIEHAPWLLQPAEAEFETNTMATAAGLRLAFTEPLLHYARRMDVHIYPPRVVAYRPE